ncbi:hypothetical protein ACIRD3_12555 [Kitasatospora sp. NPDC093550]|uniref:hypothetical protein n=1 Tax=Kitasatospora sp. NPDC093550 TaxID=3364089 RepID=UPI0037F8E104
MPGEDAAPEPTRRERAALARTDRLYEEQAAGGGSPTARRDWLLASAAAGLIHLVTVGTFVLALWLLIAGTVVHRCVGAVVLVIAVALRPRLGRLPKDVGVLDRAGAPALYGLADRVAAESSRPTPASGPRCRSTGRGGTPLCSLAGAARPGGPRELPVSRNDRAVEVG